MGADVWMGASDGWVKWVDGEKVWMVSKYLPGYCRASE